MAALATVFVVVVVSLLISRVATVALGLTGMSREAARHTRRRSTSSAAAGSPLRDPTRAA